MALETSYGSRAAGSPAVSGGQADTKKADEYWSIEKCRKAYQEYLFSKRDEINEQIDARRYYHGTQYTSDQVKTLKRRKQPIMTFNHVGRKIDGTVGQIEKLRQDPKAYARTPQHEEGAELATAVIRYVLDQQEWKDKSPHIAQDGAVDGIGGIEMELETGDQGDPEVAFYEIDIPYFFYDPQSYKADFSDAQYMGVAKKMAQETAQQLYPNEAWDIFDHDFELSSSSDREMRWFWNDDGVRRVRVVEIWYQHKGGWCWAVFNGNTKLKEGQSPYKDEKNKATSKYILFSGNVDQDGDRYGFVRNMKSAQDGINAKHSKVQHIMASKRLMISQGAVDDIEKTRAEWARADGVIVTNRPVNEGIKADDQTFDFTGWTKLLEFSLGQIDGFGPRPELIGEESGAKSGRAIALRQAAGMAELGPYILAYRGWKVRVYRAIWNAVQRHWKAERYIRVTDDEGLGQFLQINTLQIDPQTGQPTMVNAVGSLDVDIILDEGPDTINMMQDLYESLQQIVPAVAPLMPQMAAPLVGMLIDNSPLPASAKKKFRDAQEQAAQQPPPPDPEVEKAQALLQIKAQETEATIQQNQQKMQADIQLKRETAAADIELEQQRMVLTAQQQREQAQYDMQATQQKGDYELAAQQQKQAVDIDGQRQKQDMDRQGREQELEHQQKSFELTVNCEQDKVAAKTGAPTTANLKAFEEIAQGFKEGMKFIAEAMAKQAEALTEPKKITVQRDAGGKVTGAVTNGR